eukprot:8117288-Karenia_brevis.AAC.1
MASASSGGDAKLEIDPMSVMGESGLTVKRTEPEMKVLKDSADIAAEVITEKRNEPIAQIVAETITACWRAYYEAERNET